MDVEHPEDEFANVAFEVLDKSSLVKILEKLDPKSVLSLCQTNKNFGRLCDDQSVFVRLMEVHYPYFPINDDAKAQYMAITGDVEIKYWFSQFSRDEIINARFFEDVPLYESWDGTEFSIRGTRIRKGTNVWILKMSNAISQQAANRIIRTAQGIRQDTPVCEVFDKVENIFIYKTVDAKLFPNSNLPEKERKVKIIQQLRKGVQIGNYLYVLYHVRLP